MSTDADNRPVNPSAPRLLARFFLRASSVFSGSLFLLARLVAGSARAGLAYLDPWFGWWPENRSWSPFDWKRTSLSILAACEEKILSCLNIRPEGAYVPIHNNTRRLWTLSLNTRAPGTPLVLLHGMGSGVALWVLNLDALARSRPVYAIDLLGFGRSSRSKFNADPLQIEHEYVSSIEDWRRAMKLDKMILLGHSLGGYLAAAYALRHADRIKHLILADPWGFPERPAVPPEILRTLPLWAKVVRKVMEPFNPFAMLRVAGPWGPSLIIKFRGDILRKYEHLFDDTRIGEYIYHCNAQTPSGESAFKSLTDHGAWARYPMVNRVHDIPAPLSITLIYGANSWIDAKTGGEVWARRPDSYVDVKVIPDSSHHVYADQAETFNSIVSQTCDMVDSESHPLKALPPPSSASLHSDAITLRSANALKASGSSGITRQASAAWSESMTQSSSVDEEEKLEEDANSK